eukprot:gnl/TRDRNA2_/TRDRNA2_188968_c0_seq1.p1 gnl/TRDRNA2_/TRDRNA2_188968_c0~~gnl/TRDRNA2_/TRDRNA2_188968_c0_seq1.p1  ORF type:complete len:768 (+),score=174.57 gnl/TRDRNA2_/TRDRNA2_188968_c0_seq1:131-2305(+)
MTSLGLHFIKPEWQSTGPYRHFSTSFRETTLTIKGTNKTMVLPVQTCTKVRDIKEAVAKNAAVKADDVKCVIKQGCTFRTQGDDEEIGRKVVIAGITDFQPQKKVWPHPIAIVGMGYCGLKHAMYWLQNKDSNIVCFDRLEKVGGYCWVTHANKYSKLQTEFAAFHVWWGPGMVDFCGGFPTEWEYWPRKQQVLESFEYAAKSHGVHAYCKFNTNVEQMDFVGKLTDRDHSYILTCQSLNSNEKYTVEVDGVINFPGCMQKIRLHEFKGEDASTLHIGYGMSDGVDYDKLPGARVAIIGNGAFAVENVRTCIDLKSDTCYLVTRRKNLAMPRMPCWFVHQTEIPVSAQSLLNSFVKAYDACGLGDPWSYWSVIAGQNRKFTNIIQQSRFGIGDHTFLAVAYGKLVYKESTVKRLQGDVIYLENGDKLENMNVLIKSMGLIGSYEVDKLHRTKQMVGNWPDGDFRRYIGCDPLGLNASQFTSNSLGIGLWSTVVTSKFFFDYPWEVYRMMEDPGWSAIPTVKPGQWDRPMYVFDVKHQMSCGISVDMIAGPRKQAIEGDTGKYKHEMVQKVCPLKKIYQLCLDEWDAYQKEWRAQDWAKDKPYVPYPYEIADIEGWLKDHDEQVKEKMAAYEKRMGGGQSADDQESKEQEWKDALAKMTPDEQKQAEAEKQAAGVVAYGEQTSFEYWSYSHKESAVIAETIHKMKSSDPEKRHPWLVKGEALANY